jgi:hypothetical protein
MGLGLFRKLVKLEYPVGLDGFCCDLFIVEFSKGLLRFGNLRKSSAALLLLSLWNSLETIFNPFVVVEFSVF